MASSPNILTASTAVQKPDNEPNSQRSNKTNPSKKVLLAPPIESHIPTNTIDSEDHFVAVGSKFETDQDSTGDNLDSNDAAEWMQRVTI